MISVIRAHGDAGVDRTTGVPTTERRGLAEMICRCPTCGGPVEPVRPRALLKRGATTLSYDPLEVRWRGLIVPLSEQELLIFERVMVRGRATFSEIDERIADAGGRSSSRGIAIFRIRQKFLALGSADPLERLGKDGLKLRIEEDERASTATIIGLRQVEERGRRLQSSIA